MIAQETSKFNGNGDQKCKMERCVESSRENVAPTFGALSEIFSRVARIVCLHLHFRTFSLCATFVQRTMREIRSHGHECCANKRN